MQLARSVPSLLAVPPAQPLSAFQNPPLNTDSRVRLGWIPEGPAGARATLQLMRDIVRLARTSEPLRTLALSIVASCPAKAWACEAQAVRDWVAAHIVYRRDITDVETVHTPERLLQRGAGDCDDQAVLVATLLQTIGFPVRFVALSFKPNQYMHVYAQCEIDKRWLSVETTEPVPLGWEPVGILQRMVENV